MGPNERALLEALQGADDTDPTTLAAAGPFAVLGGLAAVGDTHWSGVGQQVDDTRTELGPVVSDVRDGTVIGAAPANAMAASIERAAADLAARVEALTTGAGAEATAGWALFAARAAYRSEGEPGAAPRPTPVPAGTPPEERVATALADSRAQQAHEQALAAREARMGQILATLTAELASSRDTFAAINAESAREGGTGGGATRGGGHEAGGSPLPADGTASFVQAGDRTGTSPAAVHGSGGGASSTSPSHGLVLGSPAAAGPTDAEGAAGGGPSVGGGVAAGIGAGIGAAAGAAAVSAGAVVAARRALGAVAGRTSTGPVAPAGAAGSTARPPSRPGVLGAPTTGATGTSRPPGGARTGRPIAAGQTTGTGGGGRRTGRTDRDREVSRVHYPGNGDWLDDQPSGPPVLR